MFVQKSSISILNKITPTLVLFSFNFLKFQLQKNIFLQGKILPVTKNWCYKLAQLLRSQKLSYRNYKKIAIYRSLGKHKFNNSFRRLIIVMCNEFTFRKLYIKKVFY